MGFWEDFARGFVPAYQAGLERKWKEDQAEKQLAEQRRNNLLNLVGKVAERKASRVRDIGEYMNSVPALAKRLQDPSTGELLPGSEALLSDPMVAHKVLTKINEIEQQAAKDDNLATPSLQGEVILDNFTAYTQGGRRMPVTDIDPQELLMGVQQGDWSDTEAYEKEMLKLQGMTGKPSGPEPVVQVDPSLMRKPDPKNLEGTRQAYQQIVTRMLDEDIAAASAENDETRWSELKKMREDLEKNNEKAISWNQLNKMYAPMAMPELIERAKIDDYLSDPYKDSWFSTPFRNVKIDALMNVVRGDYSEDKKERAKQLLEEKYGITDVR